MSVTAIGHTGAVRARETSTVGAVMKGDAAGWRATWVRTTILRGWSGEDGYRSQGGDEEGGE